MENGGSTSSTASVSKKKNAFTRLIDHLGDVMAWIPLFRSAKSRNPGLCLSTEVSVTEGIVRESGAKTREER